MNDSFSETHFLPALPEFREGISCMLFRLRGALFGFEIEFCKEVSELKPVHTLPRRSDAVFSGIVNFNGILQLCFMLEELIKIDSRFFSPGFFDRVSKPMYMIAIEKNGDIRVFPVEAVEGVRQFDDAERQPMPVGSRFGKALFAIGDERVILLDEDAIIEELKKAIL